MDLEIKIGLLKDEYLALQGFYEDFDRRILGIKGWSATIAIAAIGAGLQYAMVYLWLFAAAVSLIFWILEALWKRFQYCYAPRIQTLESAFLNDDFEHIAPLQIYSSWFITFNKEGWNIFKMCRMLIVMLPHVVTLFAGVVLFVLYLSGMLRLGVRH